MKGIENSPERVVAQTLNFLDWQLAKGPIIDQHGKAVSDPIAYWRAAMKRNGYYQKPAGYADPNELFLEEERAQNETLRKLAREREEKEKLQRRELLDGILQALVDEGEQHPLWEQVVEQWTAITRAEVARNPSAIVSHPGIAAATRVAVRLISGWPE